VTVIVSGAELTADTEPLIKNGRVMLPVRAVVEALGAKASWDNDKREAVIELGGSTVIIPIGSDTAIADGKEVTLDSAAFIASGRTYVPLRFIGEAFGADVSWDNVTRTATITK